MITKTKVFYQLKEKNKEELKEEMRLRKIKPNTSKAVELITEYNKRSLVISWVEDFKN